MKTFVLYHGQCPDGTGAALAAWLALRDEPVYIPVNYGQPIPLIEDGCTIYIVDFSYPRDVLSGLAMRSHQLIVLDHHATAQKDLEGLEVDLRTKCGKPHIIQFDMAKSGAVLTWEHFHIGSPVPEFFLYLQDRDLWQFKLPMSREVSMALRSFPMDFRQWAVLSGLLGGDEKREIETLKTEGVACRRLTEQQVEIMAKNHRWGLFNTEDKTIEYVEPAANRVHGEEVGRFLLPVANATVFFSEVGEKLLAMYPEIQCAAYYLDRADGKRQWGLRSREGFDSAVKIAKPFGGGGHPGASGFTQKL